MNINDIASELFTEIGQPSDTSASAIAFWLKTNIGKLNLLIDGSYSINSSNEIIGNFSDLEKTIFKKIYNISYYERLFRNALGAASVDSVVSVTDDGSTVVKINKNEIAKNYANLRTQETEELNELLRYYHSNEVGPIQVAGDDTIEGFYSPNGEKRNLNYGI